MGLYTIKQAGIYELVIEKSRFICHIERLESREQAYEFIKKIKKEYWDATHNCAAFIIGENADIQGSSDDGEPSGTAGIPMLEVLKKQQLHDVGVVVTRYFGGIKLGAGGLVRAYAKSVSGAIQQVGIVEKVAVVEYSFTVPLAECGRILNCLYQQDSFQVKTVEYNELAKFIIAFFPEVFPHVEAILTEILQARVEMSLEAKSYMEREI